MWSNNKSKFISSANAFPFRFILSFMMGWAYIIPPFSIVKYRELYKRIKEDKIGIDRSQVGEHWKEWGFYHPRVW
jgi:hypothetical protein